MLDDARRVVSQRGIVKALSGREGGDLGQYLSKLPSRFAVLQAGAEIEFQGPTGPAKGREAQWLVDMLLAYDEADDAGELHSKPLAEGKPTEVFTPCCSESTQRSARG